MSVPAHLLLLLLLLHILSASSSYSVFFFFFLFFFFFVCKSLERGRSQIMLLKLPGLPGNFPYPPCFSCFSFFEGRIPETSPETKSKERCSAGAPEGISYDSPPIPGKRGDDSPPRPTDDKLPEHSFPKFFVASLEFTLCP